MTKPTDAAVERFARVMCKAHGVDPDKYDPPGDGVRMQKWEYWKTHARAWLAAYWEIHKDNLSPATAEYFEHEQKPEFV